VDRVKELIAFMVSAVVDDPTAVHVDSEEHEMSTLYRVTVAPGNIGQALGKEGRVANAVRIIAKASAMKDKRKVYVEVEGRPPTSGGN
jgi:predicted RNA-binding protein YlqC (UPF0109 family)